MSKKIFNFLLVLLASSISLQANSVSEQAREHHLICKIMKNRETCVSAFCGDKIFIRPENIIATNQGFFINLNGYELARLPLLELNGQGYFIESSFAEYRELTATTRGPCPACDESTSGSGVCRNPQCEFHNVKVIYWP